MRKRRKWEKFLLICLLLSWCVGCDQTTKRVAEQTLKGAPVRSMLGDTVRLQYIQNTGAFLGLGARFPKKVKLWVFLIFPALMLLGMLLFGAFSRKMSYAQVSMLTLIVGGGLGNMIDRYFLGGKVTDFMNLGINTIRTGIFNVADVAIMVGVFGILILNLWENRHADEDAEILIAEPEFLIAQPEFLAPVAPKVEAAPQPATAISHPYSPAYPAPSHQSPYTTAPLFIEADDTKPFGS